MTVTARKELIFLNPFEVATEDRIEHNLHQDNILVSEDGIDWGDAAIEAFMAQLRLGQIPVDTRWPNRVIVMPLQLGLLGDFDAARIGLQAEVNRINEEGGWLKRELVGGSYGEAGSHLFADIVRADLKLGGDSLVASDGIDVNAVLELEVLPDFYGDPIEAATFTGTGAAGGTLEVIGAMPARAELKASVASSSDQLAMPWFARSRNYSPAATAAWVLEAEALTPLDSAAEASLAGASGGKVIKHSNLSTSWTPIVLTNLKAGTYLTHEGIYDVWARASTTSTTPPWLRLLYGLGDLVAPTENEPFQVPGSNSQFMVPLGQIDVRRPAILGESHRWQGIIQGYGVAGGENVLIDRLEFYCADESSGIPRAPLIFSNPIAGYLLRDEFNQAEGPLKEQVLAAAGAVTSPTAPGTAADDASKGTLAWTNPNNAKASDNTYATASTAGAGEAETHYLKLTNFGFAIPVGATITGIFVSLEGKASYKGASPQGAEIRKLALVKGGVIEEGAFKYKNGGGVWAESDEVRNFGGQTDMWNNTWTAAQVNASNFGIAVYFSLLKISGAMTMSVDSATVTIYYTESGAVKWQTFTLSSGADFSVVGATHTARRTAVSDPTIGAGRFGLPLLTPPADLVTQIRCKRQASAAGAGERIRQGAVARLFESEAQLNFLFGCFDWINTSGQGEETLRLLKCKKGIFSELIPPVTVPISAASSLWRYLWLEVNAAGRILLWAALSESAIPELVAIIFDADFATGGALASGSAGIYDVKTGSIANTREYDGFATWQPTHDAVCFGGKSAALTHKGLLRQTADGLSYAQVPYPGSDLPRLPVSGPEERPVEVVVRSSRGDFDLVPDTELEPVTLQVAYRPCWPLVPES